MKFLNRFFKTTKKEQPEPKNGQIWLFGDDIVDKYCTPIVITVTKVHENIISYTTNYSNVEQDKDINKFKEDYTFQKEGK